jgi:hypothetical protein
MTESRPTLSFETNGEASMRDNGTFIVRPGTSGLPAGKFEGYIDREPRFFLDYSLPFPHIRTSYEVTRCVMCVERLDHPQVFAAEDPHNMRDIDITSLVAEGIISYDQNALSDALLRKAA